MTAKDERLAFVANMRFDIAVRDHADKLREAWADLDGWRPLSRAYELLGPAEIHYAIVQWCLDFARRHYPGTMANPISEQHVPQLFCDHKIELPELPYLRPFLKPVVRAALRQGRFIAWAFETDAAAFGKRRAVPSDRWQFFQPDFEQNSASSAEVRLCGVEVEMAKPFSVDKPAYGRAEVERWYDGYLEQHIKDHGKHPRREVAYEAAQGRFLGFTDREWFYKMKVGKKPADQRHSGAPRKLATKIDS